MRNMMIWLAMGMSSIASAQNLYSSFQNPPQEARPRVWWHWMNGNISKDGIRKDLLWMKQAGIGGFHHFDAGLATPQVVEHRLKYMSPEWKDAFRHAIQLADSLGLETAVASAPGWSNTGGPWVKPENAMKKLVWREMRLKGGKKIDIQLPTPYKTTGFFQNVPTVANATTFSEVKEEQQWYKDLYVLAVKLNKNDKTMQEMKARVTSSAGDLSLQLLSDGDLATPFLLPYDKQTGMAWIQYSFPKRQTIKSLSIVDGNVRSEWGAVEAPVTKYLEASDDGKTYCKICDIPHGGASRQTIDIPTTNAKYFRVVFKKPVDTNPYATGDKTIDAASTPIMELVLSPMSRVNHSEEKSGYATPVDLLEHPTPNETDATVIADVLDITSKVNAEGRLNWVAPKGEWKIYRFGYSLTGKQNHPASPEATGLEVTKLDKKAFKEYMEYYLDTYKNATEGLMGKKGLHYLLIDSYEAGWETWAPLLPQEFEKRRGYSLLKWLPVLTGQIIESAERSEQFLFDWRTTLGELIVENMYGNTQDILRQRGMESYFEAHENGRLYLPDGMSVKGKASIPMGAMWVLNRAGVGGSTIPMAESDVRETASVAHIYGQNIAAGESFTVNGMNGSAYSYYPGNLKPYADLLMANGLNRFVIHESSHQPMDDKKPGVGMMIFGQWFHRHETWANQAKAWTDYLSRSCYLLQQGKNVADILWYYGEDDNVTNMFSRQHPAVPASYNYDYINKEALLNKLSYDGKNYVTPSGTKYKVLVIDKRVMHISKKVQEKLDAFKKQGAPICDARLQPIDVAWKNIAPDFLVPEMDSLRYVHRTTSKAEIYWVSNQKNENRKIDATFRVLGRKPMVWHPETGEKEEVSYEIKNGETCVHLSLVAHDAVFVVFEEPTSVQKVILPEKVKILFRHVDTPWNLTFEELWGAQKKCTFETLKSLTESNESGIKYYSGTVVYENDVLISQPELLQGKFMLDLGKVGCLAEVFVNGKNMGTVWKTPYRLDITDALQAGNNHFEIKVTNLWVNRLIGDLQPDCEQKYTYTSYPFFHAGSDLIPSGLMGPVDIYIEKSTPLPYSSIKPGQIWLDTQGKPIQAHGFQVMEHNGTYYWYGENKEFTTRGSHVWTYGIRCYQSKDLYNWEDCGLIIKPDTTNYLSPLHYSQNLDRPHIIYCKKTGKFVCWIKSMDEDGYFVILQADDIKGPYHYVRSLKPEGYGVGDFDLYADVQSCKGYVWFERPHWEMICADLSDDYTNVTQNYSCHFVGQRPPFTREAPTHFIYGGKHYLFTSGTTGYYPNESMVATFDKVHGKYRSLGNPHPTDKYHHSFCSQITDVVKVPGRKLYIAVADRWMPQIANTWEAVNEAKRMIPKYKNHQPFAKDFSEPKTKDKRNDVRTTWDVTYNGTYVFLPITFKDGVPRIEWKDEWRIEDYPKE